MGVLQLIKKVGSKHGLLENSDTHFIQHHLIQRKCVADETVEKAHLLLCPT